MPALARNGNRLRNASICETPRCFHTCSGEEPFGLRSTSGCCSGPNKIHVIALQLFQIPLVRERGCVFLQQLQAVGALFEPIHISPACSLLQVAGVPQELRWEWILAARSTGIPQQHDHVPWQEDRWMRSRSLRMDGWW